MLTALRSVPILTEGHHRLLKEAQAFATSQLAPLADQLEERGPHADREVRQILSETGWLGVVIDTKHGGLDLGHVAKTLVLQAVSRVSPAAGAILQASVLGAAPVAEYGSKQMQGRILPEIAAGRCWASIAVTDPEYGSHVLGMEATGRRSGGHYILEGEKVLVGNASIADLHCVVVRTGSPGQPDSLTAFLVEQGTPGVDVVPTPANGLRGFSADTLRLSSVRVPETSIIGNVGDGLAVAQLASVVYGRLNLAAVALGIHQRMLEETVRWTSTRKRRNGYLANLDNVRRRVAEMQHHLMNAHLAAYQAAHLLDQGEPCDSWLYNAKLTAHRAGAASSEHAKHLHGGHVSLIGSPIEQLRRDCDLINAPAGPDDLQLIRLAETALGPHRPQWSAEHIARRSARRTHAA
jgi:alkylation response protein AidB-like acyl-CoA dehydrogenase